jgi:hypothetical protein
LVSDLLFGESVRHEVQNLALTVSENRLFAHADDYSVAPDRFLARSVWY